MATVLRFYAPVISLVVCSNGVPIAIEGEVEIIVRRHKKERWNSARGWNQLADNTIEWASVHDVQAGTNPDTPKAVSKKRAKKKR